MNTAEIKSFETRTYKMKTYTIAEINDLDHGIPTETINGLHSCKPGNDPVVGQVKLFVVQHMTSKKGKPYLKIKSANAENGGTPHRIISAEKTDFMDQHGNISFNLEIESEQSEPEWTDAQKGAQSAPQLPLARLSGEDGVTATRKHLMQSANLLVLCIRATEKAVAPHQPVVAQTSEQFQSDVAKLFIEASSRRTNDGVNWWSYIDRMPTTPIKNGND